MGLRDMMIMEAIYKSIAESGKKVMMDFAPGFGFGG